MKISIIVPIYNAEKDIDKLIQSVTCQNYKNYELILVDDGSTDKSYEKIKTWASKDKKIKAYTKRNTGPGLTRKFGYQKSSGELIFFVDSDDWITNENVLSDIIEVFQTKQIDVLFFDRQDIIGNKEYIIKGFENLKPGMHKYTELDEVIRPGLGAKILKRKILKEYMFIESKVFEDLYTTYMYLDQCTNFYYIDKCFYTIYHSEDSTSLSTIKNIETFKKSLEIIIDLYNKVKKTQLRYSLALRMPHLFITYSLKVIKNEKEYCTKDIKQKINKIINIINENKIDINPTKNKIIKKIYYRFMLCIYKRVIKNEI